MKIKKLSLSIIVVLLILRIPLLYLGQLEIIDMNFSILLYLLLTHGFTAIFITINLENLGSYYITLSSIIIFLIFPIIFKLNMGDDITFYPKMIISILTGLYLIKNNYFKKIKFFGEINVCNIFLLYFYGNFQNIRFDFDIIYLMIHNYFVKTGGHNVKK